MEQSKFNFQLSPTNPSAKLGFEVWIDDQCMFETDHVQESMLVEGLLPEDDIEREHTLKFVLKGKQIEHTQVDSMGNIISDSRLEITNLMFDDIELGPLVSNLSVYHHDFNGSRDPIQEKFFGSMGCNGTAELKFTTPIYLWLLENI